MLLLLIVVACLISYIATHPPKSRPMKRTPEEFGAAYVEVQFPSRDGVLLSGWYIPAGPQETTPRGAVILCHGMMANRSEMLGWAKALWEHGFALLMFDFRAYGRSGGEMCSAGHYEKQDLLAAVDYVTAHPDMASLPLGVFGFSMGGATTILTAAEDTRIQAVATHGAFATLDRAIWQRCRHHFGPFEPIAKWAMTNIGFVKKWYPVEISRVAPINAVSCITPRPLLLLHGANDPIINLADARDLYGAAGYPKQLHILPNSTHRDIAPELELPTHQRLAQFFCEFLPPRSEEPLRHELAPVREEVRVSVP